VTIILFLLTWFLQIVEPAGLSPGSTMPSCKLQLTDGTVFTTDSLKGNILVVSFWASWNQASRKHNKQLVRLYEKYRTLNYRRKAQIQMVSISLDNQRDLWLYARAIDNLHWPYNSCDFKGWESETINKMKVNLIPSNYIVDVNGTIVAKNCWDFQLDSVLQRLNNNVPN